jgi:hypothetical protein
MGKVFGLEVPDIAVDRLGHSSEKEIIEQAAEFSAQRPKNRKTYNLFFSFCLPFQLLGTPGAMYEVEEASDAVPTTALA